MMFRAAIILSIALGSAATAQTARAPASPPVMTPGDGYQLGINDEVEVTIFSQPQNHVTRTRIKEDGTITLPFLGAVEARDLTARTLSVELTRKLRTGGFFTKPVVSVEVTQYISNSVTIFGEVATPGVYPLDRPQTVATMVARAGGTRGESADFVIVKRQADTSEHRVLLSELTGAWSSAEPLIAGDTLYVPVAPIVFVYGQVNAPGSFTIRSGMTIRQVLARAGGPTLAGSERKISIYRNNEKLRRVDLNSEAMEGDTVFVHERLF